MRFEDELRELREREARALGRVVARSRVAEPRGAAALHHAARNRAQHTASRRRLAQPAHQRRLPLDGRRAPTRCAARLRLAPGALPMPVEATLRRRGLVGKDPIPAEGEAGAGSLCVGGRDPHLVGVGCLRSPGRLLPAGEKGGVGTERTIANKKRKSTRRPTSSVNGTVATTA